MGSFPGPTWTSTHEYGSVLVNPELKLYYVHISKCASSWMKQCLSTWRFGNFTREDFTEYRSIVLLRDPVARWLSACPAPVDIAKMVNHTAYTDTAFDNFSSWLLDEHSAPQTDFIAGLDLTNTIFFKCDRDLNKNMLKFLNCNELPETVNEQPDTEEFKNARRAWSQLLETPKYRAVFNNAYARDYELLNTVKFYE